MDADELMQCRNCESCIEKDGRYYCKYRHEGDLLSDKKKEVKLSSHCSYFSERKDKIKEKKKTKKAKERNFGLLIDNYMQNVEMFYEQQPFFYDKAGIFWFWRGNKYEQVDDVDVITMLDDTLGFMGQTVNARIKNGYIEAFKRVGRKKVPKEAPKKWVQFKDYAFSLSSGKIYKVQPNYFFTNPIPHEMGETDETPVMDKLMREWVGEEYVKTAYEIMAYCCLSDYPIHLIFCLVGCGRNGKSKFLGLISRFLGSENICSTELDTLMESRFESFKLYKKLACVMGETNFNVLSKTSMLKKLSGQDIIGFEYKGKKPFDDYNYAKILISSNSLPVSEDTSEGFYRRWLILEFNNIFNEGKDILTEIPNQEYRNLSKKITKILPELIKRGKFTNQGTVEERQKRYIQASNPLIFFLQTHCKRAYGVFVKYTELFNAYRRYLHKSKKRRISYKEFNDVLALEGLDVVKTSKKVGEVWENGRWIEGIELKSYDTCDTCDVLSTQFHIYKKTKWELRHKRHKKHEDGSVKEVEELIEPEIRKCEVCGTDPVKFYAFSKYFCSEDCAKQYKINQ